MENQARKNENNKISGIIFVGFMFIGMGIGIAMDEPGVGMFIGMGAGFIASAIYSSEKNK